MTPKASPDKRKRLPRGARKARIIQDAARHFAANGFAATTRELAADMGITQALLYRYFSSKEDLIDQVFQTVFIDRWKPEWDDILADRTLTPSARLIRFYEGFLGSVSYVSLRLFMRSALDGMNFPERYTFSLNDRVLTPVIAGLRDAAGLPNFQERPFFDEERELTVMLHGSLVFTRIRKFIYDTPLPDDAGPMVALHVETYLPGALQHLKRLHTQAPPGKLGRGA
ncbi:MAG: TetR family transcriptional regulator [Alphaproteobacteria bacterium]|nr:TetR family transcriptional regulator [Alphaproteobacteria bacterium]